jgi:hypothetical protein
VVAAGSTSPGSVVCRAGSISRLSTGVATSACASPCSSSKKEKENNKSFSIANWLCRKGGQKPPKRQGQPVMLQWREMMYENKIMAISINEKRD